MIHNCLKHGLTYRETCPQCEPEPRPKESFLYDPAAAARWAANRAGDPHEALTFHELPAGNRTPSESTVKDSNPKDAIGSMKAKFSVIPAGVLFDLGNAMVEGMAKYGRHNYRGIGVRASVYYDAAMGHMADWWEGQDIDPDSELSHVTKAIASLVVLRDAMLQGKLHDDRPPRSKVFKYDFSKQTAAIIERHKDKNPKHWTIQDTI